MKTHALLRRGPWSRYLDPKPGFKMMFDLGVPFRWKLLAYLIGALITGLLEFLEIPLMLAMVLVPGGMFADAVIDGGEAIVVPILIACILLPRIHNPKRPYPDAD